MISQTSQPLLCNCGRRNHFADLIINCRLCCVWDGRAHDMKKICCFRRLVTSENWRPHDSSGAAAAAWENSFKEITLWGEQHDVVCIVLALLLTKGNKQTQSCTIAGLWCCILSASHKAINNNPRALRYAQAWEAWGFYHWGFNLQWIQQSEFWSDAAWMLSQCLIDEFWRWLPSSRTLNHFHSKLQSSKQNHSLQFHLSSFLWYHNDHDSQN